MTDHLSEAERLNVEQLTAAHQLYRALCHMPCACPWTVAKPKQPCIRCAALRQWEEAT